jgi:4'-phosphopantetheinyl transferase
MSTIESMAVSRQDFDTEVLLGQGHIRVLTARLDVAPEIIPALSARLSREERARAQRFQFETDRHRYIVAYARLRQLLGALLDVRPSAVEIARGFHGKPMLGGSQAGAGWHFNVSRCGDLGVFALSEGRRVGVDVEAIREVRGAEEIASYFFSASERTAYRALPARDKPLGFLNCWTRKEAFVKAVGTGLSYGNDRFDVTLAPGEPARILRADGLPGEQSGWRLEAFTPQPGFVAALVGEFPPNF